MNRRHMIDDHHGPSAGRANLLVRAVDGILGTHNQRTATEITSRGNRKPANIEDEPDDVTTPVSALRDRPTRQCPLDCSRYCCGCLAIVEMKGGGDNAGNVVCLSPFSPVAVP